MQRNTAIAVGLLFALGVAFFVFNRRPPAQPTNTAPAAPSASASAKSPAELASAAAPPSPSASTANDDETEPVVSEAFDTLPDGRKVPELPASAPKEVGFGVVLVAYQGAQAAPKSAPTKAEAKKKAEALISEAKHDFAAAVSKGDHGSTSDAGRVPRDVLEPSVEYVLFSMTKGDVYPEPVDTPRGYWILRRNH